MSKKAKSKVVRKAEESKSEIIRRHYDSGYSVKEIKEMTGYSDSLIRIVIPWHQDQLLWADRPTDLRPPLEVPGEHDYLTEIHPQAEAFVRTLADRLQRGAAFFLDYGFPEAEYFHPQRHMGTLMCHRAHRSDSDPLADVGQKDITAHVNFTGIALAAQDAGLQVSGFTSQGRFLLNCGLLDLAQHAGARENAMMQKLVNEHEMGELFKVIALTPAASAAGWLPLGFVAGDRTHRL